MRRCCILLLSLFFADAQAAVLHVAVSSPPLAWMLQQLGGEHVVVTTLLRPGDEPELFDPPPQQMQVLTLSSLYFSLALPFERQVLPRLAQGTMRVVPLTRLQRGQDPHVWMSVAWMQSFADRAAPALIAADAADAAYFRARAVALRQRLQVLNARLRADFAGIPLARRVFLVEHPALGYFAHDYALTQLAIEDHGHEPGPEGLSELLARARAAHISRIFVERQFSSRQASILARQLHAQVIVFDPLNADWAATMQSLGETLAASMRAPEPR